VKFLKEELTFSERRACKAIGIDRKTIRYQPVKKDSDALVQSVRNLAGKYPSFGYCRIHQKLSQQGFAINIKRLRRIYREQRLSSSEEKAKVTAKVRWIKKARASFKCTEPTLVHGLHV